MSFNQYEPYGPVVETTMRVVTWNVWGRYGRWRERQAGIEEALAAAALYPDRRFDYVLSAWPRRGGVGHPVRCERLGMLPAGHSQLSDHYGVVADLRY